MRTVIAILLLSLTLAAQSAPRFGGGVVLNKVSAGSRHSVVLTWQASSTPGVTYNVYRNGVKINLNPVTELTYTDKNPVFRANYSYTVRAYDPVALLESADSTPSTAVIP